MDPSVAKRTQETLGKVIKKPPLTDKLLSKPPFRFLHDIITEVIRNTGVLKGLYTADEMNSANVKEKDAKVAFLQKAIDVVVILNGVTLTVRPSKVVAGHEPEKTNEFLQELGKAAISKKNSSDAVKTVLAGGKPGKTSGESKSKKERSKSRDREISKERDTEKQSESGNKENKRKEGRHGSGEERKRKDQKEESTKRENSSKRERNHERERKIEKEREQEKETQEKTVNKENDTPDTIDSGLIDGNLEDSDSQQNRIPRPSSAKGQRRRHGDGDDSNEGGDDGPDSSKEQINGVVHDDELPQQVVQSRRMARPSSARPAPPKIKKQHDELEEQNARIGSGKQVASVIVDDGNDEDDETFVVEDNHPMVNDIDTVPSNESIEDESSHGGLVRTILETKKELEGSKEQPTKVTQEKSLISNAARQKERELAQKEIEKLRGSIQTLTRSANPLGKIMDYIQEDVDSMHKELEMWRSENRDHSIALKREQSITDNEIEPLKSQLKELESEVTEMVDKISTVKCNILKNEDKIHQMLSSISFNSL